ncbi:hypothetical protein BIFANG_02393 [Bifidobacterium angulatum DSM 20098 = JCM 7096]|uniref:Uncharacterized protein n=1 Tax=Bifidobacterium angulatum DSM 20098 = JCM 7096 TaxID=518635 RepID=C4FDK7_9BIFI|nr:hypothetical protein BIFANG_02393 [Bifidobacterium angulatum DSM 20098 = JCM 7096]
MPQLKTGRVENRHTDYTCIGKADIFTAGRKACMPQTASTI